MTSVVEVLGIGDTLAAARRQIARGRIRHLPVVDGNEHLVGLMTHRKILDSRVSLGHPNDESRREVERDVPVETVT